MIGRLLGIFFYFFIPIRKSVASQNLDIAFPKWTQKRKNHTLFLCYQHYGMVLVDFLCLPKVKKNNKVNFVNIPKDSLELIKKRGGGIIMSAHIGNWEYIGPSLGINGIKCAGVTQIQHNSKSNIFFNELRTSKNVNIIPKDEGSSPMIKVIKNGYYLGLISDQNAGKKGTKANFFNYPVSIPKGAGAFHLKTNTPILLGFCILSTNFKYNLSFYEMDVKELSQDSDEAIKEINCRYSKILEDLVKDNPHQYFWFHRRWDKKYYRNLS